MNGGNDTMYYIHKDYLGSGITGHIGPGSGNHWSDGMFGESHDFMFMDQQTFVNAYGQEVYDDLFSFEITVTGLAAQSLFENMVDGMSIYSVLAFGTNTLVSCFGELGPIEESSDGAIYFNNPTASAYITELVINGHNASGGGGVNGLTKNNFVKYSIEGTSVWAGTIQTGFDAARKLQPKVTTWIKGAKVVGKTTNIVGVASIGYDFATGTANSSTIADGLVLAGGAAAIFFGGVALAPWVAGAGVIYGIVSIAGGEAGLDRNIDISKYLNIVKPSRP